MNINSIVVDDFYDKPDKVRTFALAQEFSVIGNFPGKRTKPFLFPDTCKAIESVLNRKVINWYNDVEDPYTGSFQLCTSNDRTWIHSDTTTMWAGVLYLTPNAPLSGGTGIFRYRETGEYGHSNEYDGQDMTKWEMVDRLGNKYNRLILYQGHLFHASLDYFGNSMESGRLFQVFFFDTEY
jgi:hypothetical protein